MNEQWLSLKTPPVILAIFQIKYQKDSVVLNDFLQNDEIIRREYPNRTDNSHANLDISKTFVPDMSTITGKADTKINSYIYFSNQIVQGVYFQKNISMGEQVVPLLKKRANYG